MDTHLAREDAAGALIVEKLTGTITPEDNAVLRSWLDESPSNRKTYAEYAAIFQRLQAPSEISSAETEETLESIYQKAGKPRRKSHWGAFLKIAAAAAAVAAIVALPFLLPRKESLPAVHTIANLDNPTMHATLPDGTDIWLRPGSTLEYNDLFGTTDRSVRLTGEAYFDVSHNPDLPFYVTTGSMRLKVLGTMFNVKDSDSGEAEVVLAKGSVAMQDSFGNNMLRLRPGQKASWDSSDKAFDVSEVPVGDILLIKYGVVSIVDATIEEIVSEIESQLGIRIIMGESDGTGSDKLYNFNFLKDATPQSVVELLGFLCKDRTFSIEENII